VDEEASSEIFEKKKAGNQKHTDEDIPAYSVFDLMNPLNVVAVADTKEEVDICELSRAQP